MTFIYNNYFLWNKRLARADNRLGREKSICILLQVISLVNKYSELICAKS